MRKPVLATLIAATAALTMLAGCGTSPTASSLTATSENVGFDAAASKTLKQGFKDIHLAIFQKVDTNGDGAIDEYEAGPYFNLQTEFPSAARSKNGKSTSKISKSEFMAYATKGGFLAGRDTPKAFMDRMRAFLAKAFGKLDKAAPGSGWFAKGDGYLSTDELSEKGVVSIGLGFAYDKLHTRVMIQAFDPGDITAADKTGDGQLSQAEFEDLYINTVVKLINPNYQPGGGGNNPPAPPAPPEPAPASASFQVSNPADMWWIP